MCLLQHPYNSLSSLSMCVSIFRNTPQRVSMTKREFVTPKGESLSRVPLLLEEGAFQELTFIRSHVKVWEGEAKAERNRSAFIR